MNPGSSEKEGAPSQYEVVLHGEGTAWQQAKLVSITRYARYVPCKPAGYEPFVCICDPGAA